jgi:hypothetical protein
MIKEHLQQYIEKCNEFAAGRLTAEEWRSYCNSIYTELEQDILDNKLDIDISNLKIEEYGNV